MAHELWDQRYQFHRTEKSGRKWMEQRFRGGLETLSIRLGDSMIVVIRKAVRGEIIHGGIGDFYLYVVFSGFEQIGDIETVGRTPNRPG